MSISEYVWWVGNELLYNVRCFIKTCSHLFMKGDKKVLVNINILIKKQYPFCWVQHTLIEWHVYIEMIMCLLQTCI